MSENKFNGGEKLSEVSYRLTHNPKNRSFLPCMISLDFIVTENFIQRKEETLLTTCTYVQHLRPSYVHEEKY